MLRNEILVISKLKELLGFKKDKELCEVLGVKQNTISTWKKRKTLDYKKIIELCYENRLNLESVFFEKNRNYSYPIDTPPGSNEVVKWKSIKLNNSNRNLCILKGNTGGNNPLIIAQRCLISKLKPQQEYVFFFKKTEYKTGIFRVNSIYNNLLIMEMPGEEAVHFSLKDIKSAWLVLSRIYHSEF